MTQATLTQTTETADRTDVQDVSDLAERSDLEKTWRRPPGLIGWIGSADHKEIGLRYIITSFIFLCLAGVLALAMRIQLFYPKNTFLTNDVYNQFFTTHGTAMIFLFAVPSMFEGFGLYFVPLMIGTRNVSFPRLLNFSYWLYCIAGILLFLGLVYNTGPDQGWFSYVPLAGPQYAPGHRMDLWSQMVTCVEISGMAVAVEIITTVLKQRAPGMSLNRIPLFVWTELVTAVMVIFAFPAVSLCSTMLSMDRVTHLNTQFYNPAEGGDVLLWQHLFWFFGHPDVYIIFLPATGFVSTICAAFCRRRVFGYVAMVLSLIATAFIGFGVWVHHMFATPLPDLGQGLFTASSLMIVIPNGVQMFCWLATMWGGRPRLELPMLWVVGFIAVFMIGGLTGVMLASVSIDIQVTDTFFVVAHLHYVLIGGAVFPMMGAMYYWFPKWTGRMLNKTLGLWNFWLMFVGFNMTFFPMHNLGLQGMTRRRYTYLPEHHWTHLNQIATIGAMILGLSFLIFIVNVLLSYRRGRAAGENPWAAGTLEWATSSPPPRYNFLRPPTCQGREPVWENPPDSPMVAGLSTVKRQVLVTTTLDAAPDHRYDLAGESIWPFLLSLSLAGTLMLGGIFNPWYAVWGSCAMTLVLFGWFWTSPKRIKHPSGGAA